ncbi:MAG: alpha-amylase family glycosyl hydrolase, partial [Desulfuromonadales bacterium]
MARWGFTALWLIGIWERSPASQKIKQIMGNPEAVSSAYSLYDYVVARDLGGEEAMENLFERCRMRGIRLGCDVVPNHTGIYSHWVREHPEWFIQLDYPPYPGYRFTGPDLSFDNDISIRIEDGYWNHSDAGVVFRHEDHLSGRVRYIYHGNDGTHLPWNDTAQLNFLLPEVREAMIRTILGVARKYKIIRFDAAMTLAKKHYQRLWFPQPGGGAGVPSRAEHSLTREEFERLFPVEFWREVVDRVAAEVPDTLLLAEAFWLMEGYFVRTLGMHRVYNSAFMNMLKAEDNAKYRDVIKNILDFNPEILKRFVNFMNNPDEDTAVAQFGTGDKYFGVAVLLVTMPGLPMFGHGQVEGLREKYGMEYRRAYWDERVDEAMVRHHENQVFPLMRRRHLFSGSENFVFYDFYSGGHVNDDVFAFSNGSGAERALVVFNNRYADTGGWISQSVPKRVKDPSGGEKVVRPTLGEALGLSREEGYFCRFRDHRNGLEY